MTQSAPELRPSKVGDAADRIDMAKVRLVWKHTSVDQSEIVGESRSSEVIEAQKRGSLMVYLPDAFACDSATQGRSTRPRFVLCGSIAE